MMKSISYQRLLWQLSLKVSMPAMMWNEWYSDGDNNDVLIDQQKRSSSIIELWSPRLGQKYSVSWLEWKLEHRFPWQGWYIGGMLLDDHRQETTWHYQAAGWRREANRPRLKPGCMTSGGCTYDAWAGLGPLDQGHRAGHRLTEFMTDLSWPPFSLTFGLHIIHCC